MPIFNLFLPKFSTFVLILKKLLKSIYSIQICKNNEKSTIYSAFNVAEREIAETYLLIYKFFKIF